MSLEIGVEADLLGGHGLDLDDLFGLMLLDEREDDAVGFGGVAGPVDVASGGGAVGFELREVVVEMAEGCGRGLVLRLRGGLPSREARR